MKNVLNIWEMVNRLNTAEKRLVNSKIQQIESMKNETKIK